MPGLDPDPQECALAAQTCACFNFRKASRQVTQLFDTVLQPSGLRSTQLVILIAVHLNPKVGLAQLARELLLDRSTLTRNLRPLTDGGLVAIEPVAPSSRRKVATLTDTGRARLSQAIPLWKQAQQRFVSRLSEDRWQRLIVDLDTAVKAAQD